MASQHTLCEILGILYWIFCLTHKCASQEASEIWPMLLESRTGSNTPCPQPQNSVGFCRLLSLSSLWDIPFNVYPISVSGTLDTRRWEGENPCGYQGIKRSHVSQSQQGNSRREYLLFSLVIHRPTLHNPLSGGCQNITILGLFHHILNVHFPPSYSFFSSLTVFLLKGFPLPLFFPY